MLLTKRQPLQKLQNLGLLLQPQRQVATKVSMFGSSNSKIPDSGNTSNREYLNFGFFVIVREKNTCLIHRFEKFKKRLDQGFHFKLPFIDKVAYTHDIREQVIEIKPQTAVTRDNVALFIDGVLYIQVTDPVKASYNVENIYPAIANLAQTIMRSEIGKISLDKTFEARKKLNEQIVKAIHRETADWGITALRYEIKDIIPPDNIQSSMILQAEAERRKRASILTSEGDRMANINVAEAKKQSQILEAEGKAESMIIQAEASSKAVEQIDKALKGTGVDAAQFLLAQRYINSYRNLGKKGDYLVLHTDPLNIKDIVTESTSFFKDLQLKELSK
eukprot:403344359